MKIQMGLRLSAMLATTYLLVATSDPDGDYRPKECLHLREQVSFDVAGTCGAPGTITVITEEDECGIAVVGAATVGLPSGGSFDVHERENDTGLLRTPWTLSGYLTPPRRDGGAADSGLPDASIEAGVVMDAADSEVGNDGGAGDGGASDAGAGDAAPEVTVVPVPGSRAAGLGETRECKVTLGAKGPDTLVCKPAGQTSASKPDCIAQLTKRP